MKILLVIVSFMIILGAIQMFASRADVDSGLSICRGSLALSEHSAIGGEFDALGTSIDFSTKLSPLLCKTYDLQFPEKKFEKEFGKTKDAVLKNIAERIVDCFWQFGEGKVDSNVFGKQFFDFTTKNNCFNCFTFTIDEMKDAEYIDTNDLFSFMSKTPYTASADDRPFCEGDEGENPEDCIDKNQPECKRKGGICAEDYLIGQYSKFEKWSCPKKETCFVKNENLLTYMEYIYFSGGQGMISINDGLTTFTQDETYTIAFVSQTSDFGWQVAEIGSFFVPVGKLLQGGKYAGKVLFKGVTSGTGVAAKFLKIVKGVGNAGIKLESKGRWGKAVVRTPIEIGVAQSEELNNKVEEFFSGSPQIVMIAPLNEINNICVTQKEVGQKD